MAKIHKMAYVDKVGDKATGGRFNVPLWWCTEVTDCGSMVEATVKFHTTRYADTITNLRGESSFIFSKREVLTVVPLKYWYDDFAFCKAEGTVAARKKPLNDELLELLRTKTAPLSDTSAADATMVEAFSLTDRMGKMKSDNDEFIWRLRIIALHDAHLDLLKKVRGDRMKLLTEAGLGEPVK